MRDYKKIKAYQNAEKLALGVYSVTKQFPREELYGLVSQLRRAAVSVMANIAEGASRQHKKDYMNFLFMAHGSVSEVECLLTLSSKLGFLEDETYLKLEDLRRETAGTLGGLIRAVEKETSL
ncbi:MAG: four helix bundle protein [Candidatus Omnitrophica bacterium]|nr:four helix bundle protein [Candidatus Omnitrophota bacterium]